jgi:hypothetical protein
MIGTFILQSKSATHLLFYTVDIFRWIFLMDISILSQLFLLSNMGFNLNSIVMMYICT